MKGSGSVGPTNEEYSNMSERASPKSKVFRNSLLAFVFGGTICTIGQTLSMLYKSLGLDQKGASAAVSVTLIFLGALLTALRVYDNIAKHAGAGTLVPITGFANSIVAPAIEFKSEGHIMGIGAKMFIISGPVIVFGTAASVIYGIIIWVFKLY